MTSRGFDPSGFMSQTLRTPPRADRNAIWFWALVAWPAGRERPGPPGRDLAGIAGALDDRGELDRIRRVLGEGLDGLNRRTVPAGGGDVGCGMGEPLASVGPGPVGTSDGTVATRRSPPIAGVIRMAPSTDTGSIGPSNWTAIVVRTEIPATPSAGTTASTPRPAATVVNVPV